MIRRCLLSVFSGWFGFVRSCFASDVSSVAPVACLSCSVPVDVVTLGATVVFHREVVTRVMCSRCLDLVYSIDGGVR